MKTGYTKIWKALMGFSGLTILSMSVNAQQEPDNLEEKAKALEVISVTAQKRTESIQEVPISITAINGVELEKRGSANLVEIGNFAPNVQLDSGAFLTGSSQILTGFIRGIGQNDAAASLEPGVGVYVDGVYLARSVGANVDLLDVQRIEVLKGPQGTLFGRNTIGGALNIITSKPSDFFGGKLKGTIGSRNLVDLKGILNLPMSDYLSAQVSFSRRKQDGFQDIIPFPDDTGNSDSRAIVGTLGEFGSSDTRGGIDNQSYRLKLFWVPTASTDITFIADYSEADEESGPFTLLSTSESTNPSSYAAIYNACVSLPTETLGAIGLGPICGERTTFFGTLPALAGVNVDDNSTNDRLLAGSQYMLDDIDKTYGNGANTSKVESQGYNLTIDHEISPLLSIKSITAYRELDSNVANDIDGTPIDLATVVDFMEQQQVSQELQINSNLLDDTLKMVAGIYYFDEKTDNAGNALIGEGLGGFIGPFTVDTESFALYAHTNYDLTEDLGLTFGVRYTEDKKTFTTDQSDMNMGLIKLGTPAILFPDQNDLTRIASGETTHLNYSDTSVRVGLEYQLADDLMVYTSYAEAFKAGGMTTRLSVPTPNNEAPTFEPEEATTIELGFKSQILQDRIRINGALFKTDYTNMQVTVIRGISPFFENAGEAEIKGFELEAMGLATDNLTISAGLGYLDASYTKLSEAVSFDIDSMLVNTPELSANFSVDWEIGEVWGGFVTFHTDWMYKDKMARDAFNTPFLITDSYTIINAFLNWTDNSEDYSLNVGVKNLEDTRYLQSASHVDAIGATTGSYSKPREFIATFTYRY